MEQRRHANRLRLLTGLAATALLLMPVISVAAIHAHLEISIPLDTVVRAQEDSTTELATAPVPEGFAGHFCEVSSHAENQHSIHPDNDLWIQSGDSEVVLSDVEAAPGQIIESDDLLELGELITVSLVMGPDEVFSAGLGVVVECNAEATTTTTTVPIEETTTTVSPIEETTTTTSAIDETTTTVSPIEETTTTEDVSPTGESTSTSIEDEVEGIEVLPFTGHEDLPLSQLALALLAGGILLVSTTRRTHD